MNKVDLIERSRLRKDIPPFRPGDQVKVFVKVREGDKVRDQVFEGVVIAKRGGGLRESFTVRKMSFGVGVERTFPIHAPAISKLEVVRHGKVRRAKLYYLRELSGRQAKINERRTRIKTLDDVLQAEADAEQAEAASLEAASLEAASAEAAAPPATDEAPQVEESTEGDAGPATTEAAAAEPEAAEQEQAAEENVEEKQSGEAGS